MGKKRVGEGAAVERDESKGAEGKNGRKRAYRRSPLRTYTRSLPEIASALAEKAKEGSYLHARALKELADSDDVQKKRARRKQSALAQLLLDRLDGKKRESGRGRRLIRSQWSKVRRSRCTKNAK